MIQIIGFLELLIFYFAYLLKLFLQKQRGIRTNQLGCGNKTKYTIMIEKLLNRSAILMVPIILAGLIFNTVFFQNQIIRVSGLVLSGIGTCFFVSAVITMKDSWRAGIPDKDNTEMVTEGIYRFSRNPAFLGFDLTYIGAFLSFGNIVVMVMAAITILLMHLQILEEEKYLRLTFGESYSNYKNKVGRYFWLL